MLTRAWEHVAPAEATGGRGARPASTLMSVILQDHLTPRATYGYKSLEYFKFPDVFIHVLFLFI